VSSDISLGDQYLWVSNQRFSALLAFALQVGGEAARTDEQRRYVDRLRQFEGQAWPGIGFDLEEQFPEVAEKKWWASIFHDVARQIFLRRIGHHDVTFWQTSAIGDAYVVARMLTSAVQAVEGAWYPETENTRESEGYHAGRINIRL
jgi:hypothetical protein